MTTKTRSLTIKALRTRSPWEIAAELGLRYSGDLNPIPHGGYFYSTKAWEAYGYAEIVKFSESEGILYLESRTINRPSNTSDNEILGYSGWTIDTDTGEVISEYDKSVVSDTVTPEILIECIEGYCGSECDFRYRFSSDNGKDWGDFPEFQIMRRAKGLILGLCE